MTKNYTEIDREKIKLELESRLCTFSEEELDVKMVLFDEIIEHILRIDRILKQPLGHVLLSGVSGTGKTNIARFVAWMNGFSVFQIKAHAKYTLNDFTEDLRNMLRRAGCQNETICFIFDESNALDASFLEFMNALLASGEVPGLFEDDDLTQLLLQCRGEVEERHIQGVETDEELYNWFVAEVQKNLHIVFTINPANSGFDNRGATSPALFNRCVVNWMGDWSQDALDFVSKALLNDVDLSQWDMENKDVAATIVSLHQISIEVNNIYAQKTGKLSFVTPRDFIDFITYFKDLFNHKLEEIHSQNARLERGLDTLNSAKFVIDSMREALAVKQLELKKKNLEGSEKLKVIVQEKQRAEEQKQESIKLDKVLTEQRVEIEKRQAEATKDLEEVIPQLEEAQQALKNISKRNLDEIRNLNSPPNLIKLCLEAVTLLLSAKGNGKFPKARPDWNSIRKMMKGDKFIRSIVEFDSKMLSEKMRRKLEKDFFPDLQYEAVNRASVACGPMVKWLKSQVAFSRIAQKVQPLKDEVAKLEHSFQELNEKQLTLQTSINELESSIGKYEEDYGKLLTETQNIKNEIVTVNDKVEHSSKLIDELSVERARWNEDSKSGKVNSIQTLGDAILSAAFHSYSGFFDPSLRTQLLKKWKECIVEFKVPHNVYYSPSTFLTTSTETTNWISNFNLANDTMQIENAIMLKKHNRYPLIVDPTGQAVSFLLASLQSKKVVRTSSRDSGFVRTLENALRFGTPLIVQDIEMWDPILNPIVSCEFRRVGGRKLVSVGAADVDVSEGFDLFLITRDPTHNFPADISSRVTMVNFTVSPTSLQAQTLNLVLKYVKPELEIKLNEQLKLKSEYVVQLHNLEDNLLHTLTSSGNSANDLIENPTLLKTIRSVKKSANEISEKVKESQVVMESLSAESSKYEPIAKLVAQLYVILQELSQIHLLYQYSLEFVIDIVNTTVRKIPMEDEETFIQQACDEIYLSTFQRTARGMFQRDWLVLALRLAQLKLSNQITDDQWTSFTYVNLSQSSRAFAKGIVPEDQGEVMYKINEIGLSLGASSLDDVLMRKKEQWVEFFSNPDAVAPEMDSINNETVREFLTLLIVKHTKPVLLKHQIKQFVCHAFNNKSFFKNILSTPMETVVDKQCSSSIPLLLASTDGFDASKTVSKIGNMVTIAMGTTESNQLADVQFKACLKSGRWILLKNVHLTPKYLLKIEKELHDAALSNTAHPNFRLFLTSEVSPNIPSKIIRRSVVMVCEAPNGLYSNIQRSLQIFKSEKEIINDVPRERVRVFGFLALFHAIMQERLRYTPLGFSKYYPFNESDLRSGIQIMKKWIHSSSENIKPEAIAWTGIKELLSISAYGSKVDNVFDIKIIESFIHQIFKPENYDLNRVPHIIADIPNLDIGATCFDDLLNWNNNLPVSDNLAWYGLHERANQMVEKIDANELAKRYSTIQSSSYDNGSAYESEDQHQKVVSIWFSIEQEIQLFLDLFKQVPSIELVTNRLKSLTIESSIDRWYARELSGVLKLYKILMKHITEIHKIIEHKHNSTNNVSNTEDVQGVNQVHWDILDAINKQKIPSVWDGHVAHPSTMTLNAYLKNIVSRIHHLFSLDTNNLQQVNLGKILYPSAFLSSTRQFEAQRQGISLEYLQFSMDSQKPKDGHCFELSGLNILAVGFKEGKIVKSSSIETALPILYLSWSDERVESTNKHEKLVQVPLYVSSERQELLQIVHLPLDVSTLDEHQIYQAGIALTTSSSTTI